MSTLTLPTGTDTGNRSLFRDTGIVMTRELKPVLRDPFSLLFGMIQPLIFLGLFGPAILVMTTLFGTSATGANLLFEFQTGAHERMMVTPLSRSSLLIGRALKEMVPLFGQAVIVIAVMVPFGFDLHLDGAIIGLALLAVFGVGLGAFSYALALAVRKQDWMFWVVQQTFLFPLMILSGMLLPLETGPEWMRVASKFNPLSYLVDAERTLFAGDVTSTTVLWGLLAAIVTAALGLFVGIRMMLRSAA
ncbi:hypothetical protein GCM10009789_18440 [Kribbella sancticallisti]|uniref:Transport permease protein n=1 Tax=Kribbella sancticallisti TaxID=460087 RepID=A0ABP4NPC9_9ACTN